MTYPPAAPSPAAVPTRRVSTLTAGLVMGAQVALLWLLEVMDAALPFLRLDTWGISPRDPEELPQVFTAPWLHFGFEHLMANSVPYFVLGLLILLSGVRPFVAATLASVLVSGLAVWLFSPAGSLTAGASGLVFGWLAFVVIRGLFTRSWRHLLVGVVVFLLYGGILWGVLPIAAGVSWQGHLGGAVGGVLAARWLGRRH